MENYTVKQQKELETIKNDGDEMADIIRCSLNNLNNYYRALTKSQAKTTDRKLKFNDNNFMAFTTSAADLFLSYNERMSLESDVTRHKPQPSRPTLCNVSNFMGYESNENNVKCFIDGACYNGEWNALGFAGKGIYKYPHGVIYDGEFNQNGEFHGAGTLIYPNGQKIEGTWDKGKLTTTAEYKAPDLEEKKHRLVDRRYPIEVSTQLGPPGREHVTSEFPSKPLPKGCFDVVDGIYIANKNYTMNHQIIGAEMRKSCDMYQDPKLAEFYSPLHDAELPPETLKLLDSFLCKPEHCFFLSNELEKLSAEKDDADGDIPNADVKDIPGSKKEQWIKKYCRTGTVRNIGYAPELYEVFTSGAKREMERLQDRNIQSAYYTDEFVEKYAEDESEGSAPMMFAIQNHTTRSKSIQRKALEMKQARRILKNAAKENKKTEYD